ncbi:MAG: tetratricopeptide repeat protein [Planctomycetota bacterium]|jgi:tetratricopeptide (TPR) repeat protein
MARTILTAALIVLVNVLIGCQGVDSGRSQLLPFQIKSDPALKMTVGSETDIVEELVVNRQAYRQCLALLVEHYTKTGNNMKLRWANKELAALAAIPQYNYIVEAVTAGPNLRANTMIPEAEYMYMEAARLEKQAKGLLIIYNNDLLRLALDKYNQLIKKHPTSDKIDDAAFKAGGIHEYFGDYTIAALYYERVYQWDPDTLYPARFKAAYIWDKKLAIRRADALENYQETLRKGGLSKQRKEFIEERIMELTQSDRSNE